jgi:hypothetical protein
VKLPYVDLREELFLSSSMNIQDLNLFESQLVLHNMTHNARMEAAMAELDVQLQPNFSAIAKNWLLERTTLA